MVGDCIGLLDLTTSGDWVYLVLFDYGCLVGYLMYLVICRLVG